MLTRAGGQMCTTPGRRLHLVSVDGDLRLHEEQHPGQRKKLGVDDDAVAGLAVWARLPPRLLWCGRLSVLRGLEMLLRRRCRLTAVLLRWRGRWLTPVL